MKVDPEHQQCPPLREYGFFVEEEPIPYFRGYVVDSEGRTYYNGEKIASGTLIVAFGYEPYQPVRNNP